MGEFINHRSIAVRMANHESGSEDATSRVSQFPVLEHLLLHSLIKDLGQNLLTHVPPLHIMQREQMHARI